MTHYLIEFRFSGRLKHQIRDLIHNISKNHNVHGATRRRVIPHITLVGALTTENEKRLIREFNDIVSRYSPPSFRLDGFGTFDNRVIFVKIRPSEELQNLRNDLVASLNKFCTLDQNDFKRKYEPHVTLAFKDIGDKFNKILEHLKSWKIPQMEHYVIRVTLIKNQRILCEYDLVLKKLLSRSESLDRDMFEKTMKQFEKTIAGAPHRLEFHVVRGKAFLISDTHFDHQNIIQYCDRPFDSTRQMNQSMLKNWNFTVKENDQVYFLGDIAYGRDRNPIDYWLGKLNGEVFFIRGNHDRDSTIERAKVIPERYGIRYKNYEFLLMHDPHRPHGYDGWIIHGDKHNNDLKNYPLINQKNKTVNVCAELVNYVPLSLDKIILLIETGRNYKTIDW